MPIPTASSPISSVFVPPPQLLSGHQGAIYDAIYDHKGERWITAGGDGIVAAWPSRLSISRTEVKDGVALAQHRVAFYALGQHTLDGRFLAGTADGHIVDFSTLGTVNEARRIEAHKGGVFCFATFKGAIWTGGADGRVVRWSDDGHWDAAERLELKSGKVRTLCPTPWGLYVGTGSGRGFLVTEEQTKKGGGSRVSEFGKGTNGVFCAVWLKGKDVLLTGGRDGKVRALDRFGIGVAEFQAHESSVYRMAIGIDWIFSASRDKTIKAWNAMSLGAGGRAGGGGRSVNALAWDGEGSLFTGGDDRIGRVWQVPPARAERSTAETDSDGKDGIPGDGPSATGR